MDHSKPQKFESSLDLNHGGNGKEEDPLVSRDMWSRKPKGERIQLIRCPDAYTQSKVITKLLLSLSDPTSSNNPDSPDRPSNPSNPGLSNCCILFRSFEPSLAVRTPLTTLITWQFLQCNTPDIYIYIYMVCVVWYIHMAIAGAWEGATALSFGLSVCWRQFLSPVLSCQGNPPITLITLITLIILITLIQSVKAILAYLRLVSHDSDPSALYFAINYPKRGLGGKFLSNLIKKMATNNSNNPDSSDSPPRKSVIEVLRQWCTDSANPGNSNNSTRPLTSGQIKSIQTFLNLLNRLKTYVNRNLLPSTTNNPDNPDNRDGEGDDPRVVENHGIDEQEERECGIGVRVITLIALITLIFIFIWTMITLLVTMVLWNIHTFDRPVDPDNTIFIIYIHSYDNPDNPESSMCFYALSFLHLFYVLGCIELVDYTIGLREHVSHPSVE